jgi:hypothetical protein
METHLPSKKEFKCQPSPEELMLTVFFTQVPILEHYQESGTMINSACYSEILTGKSLQFEADAEDCC